MFFSWRSTGTSAKPLALPNARPVTSGLPDVTSRQWIRTRLAHRTSIGRLGQPVDLLLEEGPHWDKWMEELALDQDRLDVSVVFQNGKGATVFLSFFSNKFKLVAHRPTVEPPRISTSEMSAPHFRAGCMVSTSVRKSLLSQLMNLGSTGATRIYGFRLCFNCKFWPSAFFSNSLHAASLLRFSRFSEALHAAGFQTCQVFKDLEMVAGIREVVWHGK